jgi:Cu/Ag efflux protein CusF
MKPSIVALLLALVSTASLASAAASASTAAPAPAAPAADAIQRHPLRGVITDVLPDRASLMVKHEEIPGVMRAMTMMFKVDAATLKAAKAGQPLTALMSRQDNAWVLEDVKFISPK